MNHSENVNELATALAVAQGQMKPARMNATNPFLKSKYADLGAVMDACRDVLSINGLSFVQMAFTPPMEHYGPAVGVETMLMHKSGQWLRESFVLPVGDEKGKSIMQVAGSAISYARRYALASMLGIVADEDSDGNGPQKQKPTQAPVTRQPAPLPPVRPVPAGVDAETGEVLTVDPDLFPDVPESLRRQFHAVGVKCYGDGWDDERPRLVKHITKGKATSSKDITLDQMEKLIAGMNKKIDARGLVSVPPVDSGYSE